MLLYQGQIFQNPPVDLSFNVGKALWPLSHIIMHHIVEIRMVAGAVLLRKEIVEFDAKYFKTICMTKLISLIILAEQLPPQIVKLNYRRVVMLSKSDASFV